MELTELFFDTDEVRLHGLEGPAAGPPLVLLHGATSNCWAWMSILPQLVQRWHVYSFDLRGHGLSGRPATLEGYHLSHHVADVLALLDGVVGEPAVLAGHSYGGVIAALAGMPAGDRLRGIVLEDPPLLLRRDNEESKPFMEHFNMLYQLRQKAQSVDEIQAALSALNPSVTAEDLRPWAQSLAWLDPAYLLAITRGNQRETASGVDFEACIGGIVCPVLMMQADPALGAALVQQDLDFFMAHARDARLVTFPGSGHGIHDEQPAEFLKAFDAFAGGL